MKDNIIQRLEALRQAMRTRGIDLTIIPHVDPHQSEYMADHWHLREYLSGFNGSAGTLVVSLDDAKLWTDSRYFLQAAQQLADSGIVLMKDGLPETPSIASWLVSELRNGGTVGIDGMLFSIQARNDLENRLQAEGISLVTTFDPAQVWNDRPTLPQGKIFVHDIKYAGLGAAAKISNVLLNAAAQKAPAVFISALDEIAWVLNIRSNDVSYNPVATSFLYLSKDRNVLFIDPVKVPADVADYLASQGVTCRPYSDVKTWLGALPADARVLVDASRTSAAIATVLGTRCVAGTSPVAMLKACKNDAQLEGLRAAMLRDGVAMVKSLHRIITDVRAGRPLTELDVADILRTNRAASPLFFDESFGTIAGYGPHGAIVHYEADADSAAALEPHGLLLIDSGAQYYDGTTDITRTISLGVQPTEQERHDFTLVMKGHIALARAIFPAGTVGMQLDALARQYLWREGLAYLHGTGHGVGHFLNVHEGPQSIRLNYVPAPLTPGMVTSNEPGLYREGIHGIRCENLVLTVSAATTEFGQFLQFETLTLCPFDRSLFDVSIMTPEEIAWINAYHALVAEKLTPLLDAPDAEWLAEQTAAL